MKKLTKKEIMKALQEGWIWEKGIFSQTGEFRSLDDKGTIVKTKEDLMRVKNRHKKLIMKLRRMK